MDGVSSAASVIAVVELSAKVASILCQYMSAVKNANSSIEGLLKAVNELNIILESARSLLDSPAGSKLQTSQRLHDGLQGCQTKLSELESKLQKQLSSMKTRAMGRFGIHALKWPFESKEVESIIATLDKYRDNLSTSLTIDQTEKVLNISSNQILAKLAPVEEAAYDSHANEHAARCHPRTRVELRKDIIAWTEDPYGQCIFWLSGMAGTGKSTISRTIAQSLADKQALGASFFFKRGERDRGSAAHLFTTIASQLVSMEPLLVPHVQSAIETDPSIVNKNLREQFLQLILEPLKTLETISKAQRPITIVIDALDECEDQADIKLIIHLLSLGKCLKKIRMRAFLTSRPDLPVRLGFKAIEGAYQDLVLHQIPEPVIEHDILAFLQDELAKIRNNFNSLDPTEPLPQDWPHPEAVDKLLRMAIPLFIFAATVCRFIEDSAWCDPKGQLAKALEYQSNKSELDKLDATYRPILDQFVVGSKAAQESLIGEFRTVVGAIILLEEPLSVKSLSTLLDIPRSMIDRRLLSLHSVLNVPSSIEDPIRILHLSFRDFLIDPEKADTNPFWIDENIAHANLANSCIKLLSTSGHLKKDICDMKAPGIMFSDIPAVKIRKALPPDVRYACLYWVHHLKESRSPLTDAHQVHSFLSSYFVYWVESLSLLGRVSEAVHMMRHLTDLLDIDNSSNLSAFLHDSVEFLLRYCSIIESSPLQIYHSALLFAPHNSIIKSLFKSCIPAWISRPPEIDMDWGDFFLVPGIDKTNSIYEKVLFSPDCKTMVTAKSFRDPMPLRDNFEGADVWDISMNKVKLTLDRDFRSIIDPVFSPDSQMLVSVVSSSKDFEIRFWDATTGERKSISIGLSDRPTCLAFSPDGKTLASGIFSKIHLWNMKTAQLISTLEGPGLRQFQHIAFLPDGKTIASISNIDRVAVLWSSETYQETRRLENEFATGHDRFLEQVILPDPFEMSQNGVTLALKRAPDCIRLWDLLDGKQLRSISSCYDDKSLYSLALSPNGKKLAIVHYDRTVSVWDVERCEEIARLSTSHLLLYRVKILPDEKTLALYPKNAPLRLWNIEKYGKVGSSHVEGSNIDTWNPATNRRRKRVGDVIKSLMFLNGNSHVISSTSSGDCHFWSLPSGEIERTISHHREDDTAGGITFSPDGKTLAVATKESNSQKVIEIRDVETDSVKRAFKVNMERWTMIALSPDGKLLITKAKHQSQTCAIVWNVETGEVRNSNPCRECGCGPTLKVATFSQDSKMIAYCDEHRVYLWDLSKELETLGPGFEVGPDIKTMSFSQDNRFLKTNIGTLSIDPNEPDTYDCRLSVEA